MEDRIPTITLSQPERPRVAKRSLSKPLTQAGICFALQQAFMPQNHKRVQTCRNESDTRDMKILLAEDNPVNQKVALLMLKRMGYAADVVANGQEVLQAVKRQSYDVVLMDVQMPEMDGLEATRAVLDMKLNKRPKILAMTAYALEGDKERCLRAGMDGYISKPVKLEELRNALLRLYNAPDQPVGAI
jgi:CheY-like chemotaxis protein